MSTDAMEEMSLECSLSANIAKTITEQKDKRIEGGGKRLFTASQGRPSSWISNMVILFQPVSGRQMSIEFKRETPGCIVSPEKHSRKMLDMS